MSGVRVGCSGVCVFGRSCVRVAGARERFAAWRLLTFLDTLLRPAGSQREHRLHRNVQAGNVESLEHDLGRVLSVLGRVERRLGEEHVVLLRLAAELVEDAALPEALHGVPVLYEAVANRVVDLVSGRVGGALVADVEVEVFHATALGVHEGGLAGGKPDCGGDNVLGLDVAGCGAWLVHS